MSNRTTSAKRKAKLPKLVIVVPCYNEEDVFPRASAHLLSVLDGMKADRIISQDSAVLFVDDGSRDATWSLIENLSNSNKFARGLKLARNFGHQAAVVAGMYALDADAIVTIDADLQDPPEVIREMMQAHAQGAEIVYGVRNDRTSDTWFKRTTAESYYKFLRYLGADVVMNHADFRLMGRKALDALKQYDEVNLFLRGIVRLVGFRQVSVTYARQVRAAGATKYSLGKMLALSLNGITSLSVVPLRIVSAVGLIISILSLIVGLWALLAVATGFDVVPGWASTVLPMYFLGGIQLLSIGILGEYVGKTYMESKRRPRYVVEKLV